jgi:hypothetical protein
VSRAFSWPEDGFTANPPGMCLPCSFDGSGLPFDFEMCTTGAVPVGGGTYAAFRAQLAVRYPKVNESNFERLLPAADLFQLCSECVEGTDFFVAPATIYNLHLMSASRSTAMAHTLHAVPLLSAHSLRRTLCCRWIVLCLVAVVSAFTVSSEAHSRAVNVTYISYRTFDLAEYTSAMADGEPEHRAEAPPVGDCSVAPGTVDEGGFVVVTARPRGPEGRTAGAVEVNVVRTDARDDNGIHDNDGIHADLHAGDSSPRVPWGQNAPSEAWLRRRACVLLVQVIRCIMNSIITCCVPLFLFRDEVCAGRSSAGHDPHDRCVVLTCACACDPSVEQADPVSLILNAISVLFVLEIDDLALVAIRPSRAREATDTLLAFRSSDYIFTRNTISEEMRITAIAVLGAPVIMRFLPATTMSGYPLYLYLCYMVMICFIQSRNFGHLNWCGAPPHARPDPCGRGKSKSALGTQLAKMVKSSEQLIGIVFVTVPWMFLFLVPMMIYPDWFDRLYGEYGRLP